MNARTRDTKIKPHWKGTGNLADRIRKEIAELKEAIQTAQGQELKELDEQLQYVNGRRHFYGM